MFDDILVQGHNGYLFVHFLYHNGPSRFLASIAGGFELKMAALVRWRFVGFSDVFMQAYFAPPRWFFEGFSGLFMQEGFNGFTVLAEGACFDHFRGGHARGLLWVAGLCCLGSQSSSEGRCGSIVSSCLASHSLVRLHYEVVVPSKRQELPRSGFDGGECTFDGLPGLPTGMIDYAMVSGHTGAV